MSEFLVHNSLNITKSVKFNMTLRYFVVKGEEGEHMWVLEIGTTHPDINGDPISAKKFHHISAEDLDELIEDALSDLCSQIDWTPFVSDVDAPYVDYLCPEDGTTVSIGSNIYMTIKELLPAAGIDLTDLKVTLNNSMTEFDITSEVDITGDPYEYKLKWVTPMRVYDTYD